MELYQSLQRLTADKKLMDSLDAETRCASPCGHQGCGWGGWLEGPGVSRSFYAGSCARLACPQGASFEISIQAAPLGFDSQGCSLPTVPYSRINFLFLCFTEAP